MTGHQVRILLVGVLMVATFSSCAARGPSIINFYNKESTRGEVAILKLDQKVSLMILGCDGKVVPRSARYLALEPGRHELVFEINTQTLVTVNRMRGKKYLEAVAGRTYILKSKTGWLAIGDKWFPEVVDVTDNPELHVKELPSVGEGEQ